MLFSRGVHLSLYLVCALSLSLINPAQTFSSSELASVTPQQANVTHSAARRQWDSHRDWLHFTTRLLSDTVVTDSFKALLASGFDPATHDRFGRTALHAAAMLGQVELARFILSKGISVDVRDREGRTPLMISASLGDVNLFSKFSPASPWEAFWTESLCRPASSKTEDERVKALRDWYDLIRVHEPMLRLLLDAGADINAKDSGGRDVFDHAALRGPTGFDRLIGEKAATGEQQSCDLTPSQSPEVRGLRLGMSLRDVETRLHLSGLPQSDSCGRLAMRLDWARGLLGLPAPRPQEMEGVRRIILGFLDGRLAYFSVAYERDFAPLNSTELRANLSTSLRLSGKWRKVGGELVWGMPYSISCRGFTVMASDHTGPYVEMIDDAALRSLIEGDAEARRRRQIEEKEEKEHKKQIFRP